MTQFSQNLALTASSSSGGGPGPIVSPQGFIDINFNSVTGNTVPTSLFGSSMATDTGGGNGPYELMASSTFRTAAYTTAGFGLPGMHLRINGENRLWPYGNTVDTAQLDRICTGLPHIIDLSTATWSLTLGGWNAAGDGNGNTLLPTDPTTAATLATTTANYLITKGMPCNKYELFNEPDGYLSATTYASIFSAVGKALHLVDPSYQLAGPCESWMNGSDLQTAAATGVMGFAPYHAYPWNSYSYDTVNPDPGEPRLTAWQNAKQRAASDAKNARAALVAANQPNIPTALGEFNADTSGSNPAMSTNEGAVFVLLYTMFAFNTDPLTRYGCVWDWLGDGYFGLIIDPNNNPGGYTNYAVTPTGYALKICRQYLGGTQVNVPSSMPSTGTVNGEATSIAAMCTKNGSKFALLLLNYTNNAVAANNITLSQWPVNTTGTGTIYQLQISASTAGPGQAPIQTTLNVVNGIVSLPQIPAKSVTLLTSSL